MGSCPVTDIDPCTLPLLETRFSFPDDCQTIGVPLCTRINLTSQKNSRFNVQVQPFKRRLGITGNISCYILIQCSFYPFSINSCDPVKSWFLAQHLSR